ncbi:Putative F-box/LRR-repeat protein At3g58880 [Linum perenne]
MGIRRRKKMKKEISSASTVDRISELPEEIIHAILARLESHESAARTSILSKRWLSLWSTFPVVEFKRYCEREKIQRKFQSFAAATSKRLLAAVPPLPLDSFTIELRLDPDWEQLRQCLHQLLSSVPGGRSSPIKVVIRITLYRINSSVLAPVEGGMLLNFSRTKFLDLTGFDLSGLQNFENCHLDNLQELSLGDVRVCRQSFPIFLANAPHLKELRMARISEIDHTLDISASNFPSSPLLLDSFTINLQPEDNLRQGLYQLLSLLSVGVDDGGRSSPIKVVVNNNKDISASLEGGMLLTCGRTKFLDLKGFDPSRLHRYETCLDNLQELSLEHIRVSKHSFPSCLAKAHRLEKLKLKRIQGIDSLDISASNFPSLVSLHYEGNAAQQLQVSSDTILQTLHFQSRCNLLKLVSAPSVKTVHLSPVGELSCSELEKLISKFPSLESLYLNGSYNSSGSKLRVSSHTLRELSFAQSISTMELEIDTPNLATLTIHTNSELKINSTVVNVHPSCRFVFDCASLEGRITTRWFIKLRKRLAALAARFRQLVFKLDVCYLTKTPRLDLSQVGHECAPLAVRHLLMGIDFRNSLKEAHKTGLLDGLLWTVHPKALSVAMSSSDSSLFSYISEQIEMKNLEKCCSNDKCWRHQFKDAKITSVTVDDVSTADESVISQPSIDMVFLITSITSGRYEYRVITGTRRKKMKKAISSASTVDRISELPEEIIHGILARLDSHESAARTSILSKRWLRLWSTFPFVEFKRYYEREEILQRKFQSFAAATSKRLLAAVPPLPLDSFTIELRLDPDWEQLRQCLHQLLSSVPGGRSSPIKVVIRITLYRINSSVLAPIEGGMLLNFSRTKFLDLTGFDLSRLHRYETRLDNLQELSLEHIRVSKHSFPSCLAKAHRLEKLKLKRIQGIDSLDISASNFPSLVSLHYEGNAAQQLQVSSDTILQTLHFQSRCNLLKLVSAPSVKTVHLSPVGELSCSELEKLISKFPSLESLYLNGSYNSSGSKLRVSSHTLRELSFAQSISTMELEIDTPNLATLTIHTNSELKINSTVVNVHPSCRFVFDCPLLEDRITTRWFIKLRKRLAALAARFCQLVFKLDICYLTKVPELDLSKVGHECAPLAVRHLLMATDFRNPLQEDHKTGLLDGLLWTVHPKALSVAMSSSDSSLSSYISEQIEMKNLEKCCSNGKCWRHQFKDAKITSVTVDDVSTIDESVISQPSIDMIFLITSGRYEYYC